MATMMTAMVWSTKGLTSEVVETSASLENVQALAKVAKAVPMVSTALRAVASRCVRAWNAQLDAHVIPATDSAPTRVRVWNAPMVSIASMETATAKAIATKQVAPAHSFAVKVSVFLIHATVSNAATQASAAMANAFSPARGSRVLTAKTVSTGNVSRSIAAALFVLRDKPAQTRHAKKTIVIRTSVEKAERALEVSALTIRVAA